jgi:hypothetical protein
VKICILNLSGVYERMTLPARALPEDIDRIDPFALWLTQANYMFYPAKQPNAFSMQGGMCLGFVTDNDGMAVGIVYEDTTP